MNASPAPVESTGSPTGGAATRPTTSPPAATTAPCAPSVTTTRGNLRLNSAAASPGSGSPLSSRASSALGTSSSAPCAYSRKRFGPSAPRNPADAGSTLTGTPRSTAVRSARRAAARLPGANSR